MRKILVTAIGGDVGHSVLKCIDKKNNYIIGCDLTEYPVGFDLVDEYFISKKATDVQYIEDLLNKIDKYNITHIIVINELEIKAISQNRQLFSNYKILINSEFIISTFLDKYKTYEYLKSINVSVPATFKVTDELMEGRKYIIKLNSSSGSKFLKIFTYKNDLDKTIEMNNKDYIIQEYIDAPDDEYTIGVFSDGNIINSIAFKRTLSGGYTKFVEFINNDLIMEACKKIAVSINLKGSINIQLRIFNNQIFVFEINPRLSGTTNFRRKLGFDDVNWWLDFLDGKKISEYKPDFTRAIGVRELNEKFIIIE